MVTNRTKTQVAFDGVRTAWQVVSGAEAQTNAALPLSIDGVRWDRTQAPVVLRTRNTSEVHHVLVASSEMVTGTIDRWMRSMDGIRLQPRLNV